MTKASKKDLVNPAEGEAREVCPTCGRGDLRWEAHPTEAGRVVAFCVCNSIGPVFDRPGVVVDETEEKS